MSILRHFCAAIAVLLLSVPAYADLFTFSSRPAFNSAAPGLPVETFETGLVPPGGITSCTGPLSGSAASACFPLGGLLPGIVYSASPNGEFVVMGAGFDGIGNTSKVLGPNFFVDSFNINFTGAVTAVGFDVFPGPSAGNIAISLFSPTNALLGMFNVFGNVGANFFGVLSTTSLIGRINIASQASIPGELIDNLAFGVPVPEPSSLFLSAGGLGIMAGLRSLTRRGHRQARH
jgi:hypothetical protein